MRTLYVLAAMAFISSLCWGARKSDGKTHLTLSLNDSTAKITIDDGFHFNTEAPTYLENDQNKQAPEKASAEELFFRWKDPLKAGAKIQYYVCDNAKTVCEPHVEKIAAANEVSKSKTSMAKNTKSISLERDDEGFIVNNLDAALKEAKKKKSLVLVDFTASWCPACIRLTHESFNTELFKSSTKSYVLAKIDVDLEENSPLLEKYSIRAFPTLVITNSEGLEIDRILDFLPPGPLSQKLTELNQPRSVSLNELKKKALSGNKEAAMALGKNAFRAQQHKECLEWFEKSTQKPIEYYHCLISQSEEAAPDIQIQDLGKAIEAFPSSFYSIEWRLKIIDLLKTEPSKAEESKKYLSDAEILVDKWINNSELRQQASANNELVELKDLLLPELYYYLGTIKEAQTKKAEASKHFELAVQKTLELNPTVDNPTIIIYLVHYLKKTQSLDLAMSWLQKLEQAYPKEFTYPHRLASLLTEMKDYTKALPVAERAFNLSYGTNKLKTGLLLAKVKKELKQVKEAKAVLIDLQKSKAAQLKNNKPHREKIEKLIKELEAV